MMLRIAGTITILAVLTGCGDIGQARTTSGDRTIAPATSTTPDTTEASTTASEPAPATGAPSNARPSTTTLLPATAQPPASTSPQNIVAPITSTAPDRPDGWPTTVSIPLDQSTIDLLALNPGDTTAFNECHDRLLIAGAHYTRVMPVPIGAMTSGIRLRYEHLGPEESDAIDAVLFGHDGGAVVFDVERTRTGGGLDVDLGSLDHQIRAIVTTLDPDCPWVLLTGSSQKVAVAIEGFELLPRGDSQ